MLGFWAIDKYQHCMLYYSIAIVVLASRGGRQNDSKSFTTGSSAVVGAFKEGHTFMPFP